MADVDAWVESPLWPRLREWVEQTYQTSPSVEHSCCSGAPGWNIKYKKSSKSLCVIYPQAGYFVCLVSIGAKLIPELECLLETFSADLQALYAETAFYMGGKWLMIEVRTEEHLEDVQRLVLLRAKPPKRKA